MAAMRSPGVADDEMTALAREAIRKNRTIFMVQGVIMILLGVIAVALPQVATLAIELMVGWLFLIGGVVRLVTLFTSSREAPGFWWNILTAVLAIVLGLLLVLQPLAGILTLTMVLIVMFLVEGVFTIMLALDMRRAGASSWGWMVVSGIIDIILAALILGGWPGTAGWAIGLLVGINLLFAGIALVMTAAAAKRLPE